MGHFTLDELCHSDTAIRKGIDNSPTPEIKANLDILLAGLERVRDVLGQPMFISSGFRNPKLNAAVGGSKSSDHMKGLAADFTCPAFGTPKEICKALMLHAREVGYRQLINEQKWVHVSFPDVDQEPDYEVLTAHFSPSGTSYTKGLA